MCVERVALPEWVEWVAQDADGAWWGYEIEPLQYERGWYENEVGRRVKIGVEKANVQWRQTLRQVR